jgi:hypothetical protein
MGGIISLLSPPGGDDLEQVSNINAVPDGSRFLDLHPENRDARTGGVLGADFLRPYSGYGTIDFRSYYGTSNYNALQVQVNRRYIRGLQFSLAYTLSRALGIGDDDCRLSTPFVDPTAAAPARSRRSGRSR